MDRILTKFVSQAQKEGARWERLYLFGSRATGRERPDSDYDVLVVVRRRTEALLDALYKAAFDQLLTTGRLISLKIFTRKEFERLVNLGTPFMSRVLKEGIPLGQSHRRAA